MKSCLLPDIQRWGPHGICISRRRTKKSVWIKVGKVPVRFEPRDGMSFGEMRQVDPEFGPSHAHADVAKALNVPLSELDESLPIQSVSTGMWFTMVPFRSLPTLQNLKVSWQRMEGYLRTIGGNSFFYFVARE